MEPSLMKFEEASAKQVQEAIDWIRSRYFHLRNRGQSLIGRSYEVIKSIYLIFTGILGILGYPISHSLKVCVYKSFSTLLLGMMFSKFLDPSFSTQDLYVMIIPWT